MEIPELADIVPSHAALDGSKVKIDSILNLPLVFTGWSVRDSKHKKDGSTHCLTLQFERDGEKHVVFTGSNVLLEQIHAFESAIGDKPKIFKAKIVKIGNFYKFCRSDEK